MRCVGFDELCQHCDADLQGTSRFLETGCRKIGASLNYCCAQVQLSAYPNHIGENIKDLDYFMSTHLKGEPGTSRAIGVHPCMGPTSSKQFIAFCPI